MSPSGIFFLNWLFLSLSVATAATKDLSVLSDISSDSQEPALDAILLARERGETPDMPFLSMEDHLVAIAERVEHMRILGSDLPLASIAAFRALWPEMEVPKELAEFCSWIKAAEARLSEWRDSAGRIGIFKALQIVLSWYEGINLESLNSIRGSSEYYTDDAAKKRLEAAACRILEFTDVHGEFFKDINEPEEPDAEDANNSGTNAEGEESGGDLDELLFSDEARHMAPPSGTGAASDTAIVPGTAAGAGASSAAPPSS